MTNRLFKTTIIAFLPVLFLACASIKPIPYKSTTSKHILEKNYEIGKQQSVYIGEEIVRVKDYKIWKSTTDKLEVLNDFEVKVPFDQYQGSKGDKYQILGMSKKGDNPVIMIKLPGLYKYKFGINQNGYFADYLLSGASNAIQSTFFVDFMPKNTKFKLVEEEKINVAGGFTNFEIIYTGKTGQSINLLYREYSPDNLARPAF